ncbi:defective in cullin neddylation protein [Beauveria bassiana ARSEF 2860]|uniref:Defective in cullin neddylation protein n=1 Tax=Beauveria bassiana (strain ARSEF 2860) TaxID=655819 RepID=J5JYN6_BEAB2|nr:defective in cullin neddylation protein [Beauveria bassiana ARSEF 2860]EJP67271.1 defective in cullin neddylation protein [Beauveria bassiana ARSEF 2860]
MAPTATQLRSMVSQFTAFTGTSEKTATKFIKASNYRVNEAIDDMFAGAWIGQGRCNSAGAPLSTLDNTGPMPAGHWWSVTRHLSKYGRAPPDGLKQSLLPSGRKWDPGSSDDLAPHKDSRYFRSQGLANQAPGLDSELDSLFDSLRDDSNDTKDRLELTSTMNYLTTDLKVNIENAELFVVLELLQAPSIGEITRKGYVEGWKDSDVNASQKDHAKYVRKLVKTLPTDVALFKRVYKHTFVAGREKDQKSLSLENALVYWDMLFAPPGMQWKSEHRDWLPLWKEYLNEKWHHSVNRDMWNMTLEFAFKSMEDDSLSFWDENGAWPGAIDDFVAWCKAKGMSKSEQMEVDDA